MNAIKIQTAIEEQYGSVNRFSKKIGLAQSTLSRILNNLQEPSIGKVHNICHALQWKVGYGDFLPDSNISEIG